MELKYSKREMASKGEAKRLRRAGKIPAIVYGPKMTPESISIDRAELQGHLRKVAKEQLSTTVFVLKSEAGATRRAILKDVQYQITSYDIIHLDFTELRDELPVRVNVPIRCLNVADCAGIKEGGVLRRVIRAIKVVCLPKDIPSEVTVDVASLGMRQTRRLSELTIPDGVRPLAKRDEVAVVVGKK